MDHDLMALRRYSDRSGRDWNVWSVQPGASDHVQDSLRDGWLCFQCADGGDRFRVPMSDVPAAWEELPVERLDLLRRVAALGPTTEPMRRVSLPERDPDDVALISPSPSA